MSLISTKKATIIILKKQPEKPHVNAIVYLLKQITNKTHFITDKHK